MLLPICQITLLKHGGYCVGDHLFPFRTESLSPIAPMVLVNSGRVGRRHTSYRTPAKAGVFVFKEENTLRYLFRFRISRKFELMNVRRYFFLILLFMNLSIFAQVQINGIVKNNYKFIEPQIIDTSASRVHTWDSSLTENKHRYILNIDSGTMFEVIDPFFNSFSDSVRPLDPVSHRYQSTEPVWSDLWTLFGSIGGPMFNPLVGLQSDDYSFSGFLSSQTNHSAYNFRRGPLPMVEWLYSDGHGRGQSFGFRVSGSRNLNNHFDARYVRTQTRGTLLNESYFRDDLLIKSIGINRNIGLKWKWLAQYQSGENQETGGISNPEQLDSSWYNLNRQFLDIRWSSSVKSYYNSFNWDLSGSFNSFQYFNYHIESRGFIHLRKFDAPSIFITDTIVSRKARTQFSFSRKGGLDDIYVSFGVQHRLQRKNGIDSLNGPRWDPYMSIRSPFFDIEYGILTSRYDLRIKSIEILKGVIFSEFSAKKKQAPLWSGQLEPKITEQSGMITLKLGKNILSSYLRVSQGDNVLHALNNDDIGVWSVRDPYRFLKISFAGRVNPNLKYSLNYSQSTTSDLGIAPWVSTFSYNHEWIINSQTRLFIGFTAYGWTGNWNRPFYVPQRGTFAFSKESVVEENRRVDGLITPFIGVRFKTEAEIVLNIQNVNQGWLPNSVFLVENYPSPPLAIRVTGRWRMFN